MAAEVTMIVIDNSDVVLKRGLFKTQCEIIKLYCCAKINSNPKNIVGGVTTSDHLNNLYIPNSNVEHFLKQIAFAIQRSQLGFAFARIPEDMKKRILVFAGGPVGMNELLQDFGRMLKEKNVDVDVVSFSNGYNTESLEAFVAAAEKDHNSHFANVPHKSSSVRDILLRSNILSPSEAATVPLTEREKKQPHKMKKRRRKKKDHHSQYLEKLFPRPKQEEARPHVIFPSSLQVPENYKNQLAFGSFKI